MIKAKVSKERAQKDKDDVRAILKFTAVDGIRMKAEKESTLSLLEALTGRHDQ